MNKYDWLDIKSRNDPNDQWIMMFNILLEIANKMCPVKTFNITKNKPIYITNEILELIKERDTVVRIARTHQDDEYWHRGQNLIKEVVRAVSQSKKDFIINQLEENRKDSLKFWKTVKQILPDTNSSNINVIWDPDKNEMVSGILAANLINRYFSGIGKHLSSDLEHSDMVFDPLQHDCSFEWMQEISIRVVIDCLDELPVRKSSGIPELSSKILLACLRIKVDVITCIFNN